MVATVEDVVSLDEAKAFLNIDTTEFDLELAEFVAAAVDVIARARDEVLVDRQVVQVAPARGGSAILSSLPVRSVTAVEPVDADGEPWVASELVVTAGGVLAATSGRALSGLLRITYDAGMDVVPARYSMAAKLVLGELWSTQRARYGGGRAGRYGGSAAPGGGEIVSMHAVPPAALELLGPSVPGVA